MTFTAHNNKAAKLTGEKVMDMRAKYATGDYTQARLSREFQVSISTVRNVLNGITWQTLPLVKSEDEIMTDAKLLEHRAAESLKRLRLMAPDLFPPTDSLDKMTSDIADARKVDNELEKLKGK